MLAIKFRSLLGGLPGICHVEDCSSVPASWCIPWRVNFQLPRTADGQVAGAHDPREWGYKAKCQHATSIPGYWPDESRQHGTSLNSLFLSTSHLLYNCPPRSSADPPSSQQELDADVRQQKLERGKPPTAWTRGKHCKVDHTSSIQKFKIYKLLFTLNFYRALLSCFGWLYAQASHLGFTPMTELTFPLATQVKEEEVVDNVTWCCCSY